MRSKWHLAGLAIAVAASGLSTMASAASLAGKAGDIGRSVSKIVEANASRNGIAQDGTVPLPMLRYIALGETAPLPTLRAGYQLASLQNEYLAVLPRLVKPRVLDGDETAALPVTPQDTAPRPRIVTWSRNDADAPIVAGGQRSACFHCLLKRKAEKHGVPFRLARAVVKVESNYRRDAVGGVGEIGLMQIRPQTARWLGFQGEDADLFNPRMNLEYGVKYLSKAWRLGEGKLCRVILKYNAGHNAKRMNPMSQRYCDKVEAILERGLGPIRQASL